MSMIKNILVSFSLLFLSIISYGQNFTIVEKEGEKYYQHKVESGHTLYAIATLYDSDEEIIRSYNEELLTGGLNVGQGAASSCSSGKGLRPKPWLFCLWAKITKFFLQF